MIIDAMTTAHRNEYFRNLLEHQRLTLESVTEQRDRLAEELKNLKSQLTQTQGAVTISRNGYVQELEQQRDKFENKLRIELRGHPDSKLWGEDGLIAATMRCADAFDTVTEQRDRLVVAARTLPDYDSGILNDFGGGYVEWWQDYLRAEIGRANDYWRAALAAVEGGSDD